MLFLPHPLSLFALIFGILLTMRKLDVGHRMHEQHLNVPVADFEAWKAQAMAAYGLGIWACFLKLCADFGGKYLFSHYPPPLALARTIGVSLDVIWVIAMFATYRRIQAAHKVAARLAIETPARHEPDSEAP